MKTKPSTLPPELAHAGSDTLEEWFLNRLQESVIPFDALAAILRLVQSRGHKEKAEAYADLLHDTLAQRRAEDDLQALWELRAEWHADDPDFTAVCRNKLGACFQGHARMETLLGNAGFDRPLPATECLRRFRRLRALLPGALCYEKTWGFGIVADIAEYDQQVRIDFEKKKGHLMSLAYAAETLQPLDADHILVRKHRDPDGFAAWLREDPAGVVKSTLQSFGPLSVPALQDLMTGRILPADQWKSFWDAARKGLKKDPFVEFPAKRNDPIRLLEREKSYDDVWLDALSAERDIDRILDQIEEWKDAVSPSGTSPVSPAVQNRLAFVIYGADRSQEARRAHALLLADELGILDAMPDAACHIAALFIPEALIRSVHDLPVARLRRLLLFMNRRNPAQTADALFQVLPQLALAPFNEAVDALRGHGAESRVIDSLRLLMAAGNATPEMVHWLCRHEDFCRRHSLSTPGRLALAALNAVESLHITGERLKARNQLRALLEQSDWLTAMLGAMDDLERRHFITRMNQSPAWAPAERYALIHRLTQAHPDLKPLPTDTASPAPEPARRLTSLRSYRERQAQLHKLITEDIPHNSREIATARGYGDLRENFEYTSARETQGILMRRREELEAMLGAVTSTDFEGFPTTAAGLGTRVTLAHADGRQDHYIILGEWDSHESLGIISSKSKLAEALLGHKPGEEVSIPTETGIASATLAEVAGLTEEIKAWIRGA